MGAIDSGNTAWILTSASLVFLMTPGVAFFYGGMVRAKAVLNMLMLEAAALSVTMIIWTLWGWSIAYAGSDIGGIFGDPASGFLLKDSMVAQDGVFTATGLNGNNYPVSVDVAFQVAFAMITVGLICGAIAERVKYSTWMIFVALWVTFDYAPMAHMVWNGGLLSADGAISKAIGAAAHDFAGGTVVHINAAVAALIMVSGGSGEDVISVVFRPFVNFIRVIAWLAECLGVIYLFGYIPHSWSYYDDFSRAGICNQAHEAPLLVKANRDGNIQQLTFSLKGCPLEYWEDNRTTIESALNVTVLSITQGSNNQLFDLRVVAGCNLMGRLIPWADTYMDDSGTKIVLGINAAGIPVSIDFSQLPHWLLAAATGMGKTQLALLILYQLSQKGYDIYLADYKGVDFGPEYRKTGHYADDDAALRLSL